MGMTATEVAFSANLESGHGCDLCGSCSHDRKAAPFREFGLRLSFIP